MWLLGQLPEDLKPDRVHCYAHQADDMFAQVKVDPDYPETVDAVIDHVIGLGLHVIMTRGHNLRFVGAKGKPSPQKIIIDWTL